VSEWAAILVGVYEWKARYAQTRDCVLRCCPGRVGRTDGLRRQRRDGSAVPGSRLRHTQRWGPFSGTVQGTHIGKGTFSGSFVFIGPPILPCSAGSNVPNFTRVQTLTAANGDTINQTTVGTVCQLGPTTFPAEETYTIVGGTGRFSTATGSGHQTSFADFSNGFGNPATYTFTQDGKISFNH
jgi:hypothetical protein